MRQATKARVADLLKAKVRVRAHSMTTREGKVVQVQEGMAERKVGRKPREKKGRRVGVQDTAQQLDLFDQAVGEAKRSLVGDIVGAGFDGGLPEAKAYVRAAAMSPEEFDRHEWPVKFEPWDDLAAAAQGRSWDGTEAYVIHPSTRERGRWQVSGLDQRGPFGHNTFDTQEEAQAHIDSEHIGRGWVRVTTALRPSEFLEGDTTRDRHFNAFEAETGARWEGASRFDEPAEMLVPRDRVPVVVKRIQAAGGEATIEKPPPMAEGGKGMKPHQATIRERLANLGDDSRRAIEAMVRAEDEGEDNAERAVAPAEDYKVHGTRAASFKAWFGDWENDPDNASKVIDGRTGEPKETHPVEHSQVMKGGKPVTVYHGTAMGGFRAFDPARQADPEDQLYGPGFYFTEDKGLAESYVAKGQSQSGQRIVSKRPITAAEWGKLRASMVAEPEGEARRRVSWLLNDLKYVRMNADGNLNLDSLSAVLDEPDYVSFIARHAEKAGVPIQASGYEGEVKSLYLNIRKPFNADTDTFSIADVPVEEHERLATFIRGASSPLHEANFREAAKAAADPVLAGGLDYQTMAKKYGKAATAEILKAAGHDGLTHIGGRVVGDRDHRVWIAFEPSQVKDVENEGTFDPSDADMFKAIRPVCVAALRKGASQRRGHFKRRKSGSVSWTRPHQVRTSDQGELFEPVQTPDVLAFRSGAQAPAIMAGYIGTGVPIGIDVQAASEASREKAATYARQGGMVFVDSGAFGAFRKGKVLDFEKLLDRYDAMVEGLGAHPAGELHLVAPDVVGDQAATLALLERHKDRLRPYLAKRGVHLLVPFQVGALHPSEMYDRLVSLLGTDNFVAAIPSNEAAMSADLVADFVQQSAPRRVHLLGTAWNPKIVGRIRHLSTLSPETRWSVDASRHRALVGKGRPITEQRKRVMDEATKRMVLEPRMLVLLGNRIQDIHENAPEAIPEADLPEWAKRTGIPEDTLAEARREGTFVQVVGRRMVMQTVVDMARSAMEWVAGPMATTWAIAGSEMEKAISTRRGHFKRTAGGRVEWVRPHPVRTREAAQTELWEREQEPSPLGRGKHLKARGMRGAPEPGEKGWRPLPWHGEAAQALVVRLVNDARTLIEDPMLMEAFQEMMPDRFEGAEPVDDPEWNAHDLAQLLAVPFQGSDGERLDEETRTDIARAAFEVATDVRELGLADVADALHRMEAAFSKRAPRVVNLAKRVGDAVTFVREHHRHLPEANLRGANYVIGVERDGRLAAVAIAGAPTGRWSARFGSEAQAHEQLLELTRVASDGSARNAASMLTARMLELAKQTGRTLVTYQFEGERGAPYRALMQRSDGYEMRPVAYTPPRASKGGERTPGKIRWEAGPAALQADPELLREHAA